MVLSTQSKRTGSLDRFSMILGSLLPAGIIMGNAAFESIIALIDLLWILRLVALKEIPFPKAAFSHPLILPWIAWLGTLVISFLLYDQGINGWLHDLAYARYLLFVFAMIDLSNRLPIQRYLIAGMVAGAAWTLVNFLSAYLIGYDLLGHPLVRYTGKLKEGARIAGLFAFVAPFFLGWAVLDGTLTKKGKVLAALVGVLSLALVWQTNIRTSFLAGLAGIATCLACFIYRKSKVAVLLLPVFLIGLGTFIALKMPYFQDLNSIYDRIYIWKVAVAMWQEHPLFGVGVASFHEVYKSIAASGIVSPFHAPNGTIFNAPEALHAHNLLLTLLACGGISGFLVFSWLFINAVRLTWRAPNGWRLGLISWPVVFLFIGVTGWDIYHNWYQAVFAYFVVLVGCSGEERTAVERHEIHFKKEPGPRWPF